MDYVKEAFQKVKQDMNLLKKEIDSLRDNLIENRKKIIEICEIVKEMSKKTDNSEQYEDKNIPTDRHIIPASSTNTQTHNLPFEALKPQNMPISTGNQGVSTDRQTDNTTDRQTQNSIKNQANPIESALEVLDSLDSIKKEIRLKFKGITEQEFLVFSTIYQLEEEFGSSDYKTLSKRLNLTESSIRDYVGRLIKKGIPIEKKKINNKNIMLFISENLKKIVTLPTILQLREL
jgi:DNA-binding MarR family transcriptional regulator